MQFKRLEINGFKSFAETSRLEFYEGITGIVGPNGCGKSNIVEAIRWVMGENSARKMRSSEMNDVIFNGTQTRAKRQFAEISLVLDNQAFEAPTQYNHHDELTITRRIDRGEGSLYSINGQKVRASDVQLLFADLSLGAGGSAQISQGMVSEIIHQRASERRKLLEEAAGIRGLRVRREAAERKLDKTEENLIRISDTIILLNEQYKELQLAAEQARQYKAISTQIQNLQSKRSYLQYQSCLNTLDRQKQQFIKAQADSVKAEIEKNIVTEGATEHRQKLQHTQEKFYEIQAKQKRFEIELENFDKESEARKQARTQMQTRKQNINTEIETAQTRLKNAETRQQQLQSEMAELQNQADNPQVEIDGLSKEYQQMQDDYRQLQQRLNKLNQDHANAQAVHQALCKEKEDMQARHHRLGQTRAKQQQQLDNLQTEMPETDNQDVAQSRDILQQAQQKTDSLLQEKLPQAENEFATARANMEKINQQIQQKLRPMQEKQTQLSAEIDTLSRVFQRQNTEFTMILDRVEVAEGFETALSAVLADDLEASIEPDAPIYWQKPQLNMPLPPLPEGVRSMAEFVKAPEALSARLSQIGVIFDNENVELLTEKLAQGQRLVNQKGAVWRWDGFRITQGALAPSATKLEERNRLASLVAERGALEETLFVTKKQLETQQEAAREIVAKTEQALQDLQKHNRQAVEQLQTAQKTLNKAENDERQRQNQQQQLQQKRTQLQEKITETQTEQAQVQKGIGNLETQIARIAQQDDIINQVNMLAREREERDMALRAKHSVIEQLKNNIKSKQKQLQDLQQRRDEWQAHQQAAQEVITRLNEELQQILQTPNFDAESEQQNRQKILDLIADTQKTITDIQTELSNFNQQNHEYTQKITALDMQIRKMEEVKIRSDEGQKINQQQLDDITQKISEEFGTSADKLPEIGEFSPNDKLPSADRLSEQLRQQQAKRDALGAVNLRAEIEQEELRTRLDDITAQSDDLQKAVIELRNGITRLNSEARKELLLAFDKVNKHFSEIFLKLFGGGKAMIRLDNDEEPLHAGLEILASPPGKKLHNLSLLSGGEQAMTSLALVMAIFMTKPMPLCVLDEVDAPLDDENVRRLYDLIEELNVTMQTRFILVTHHRMGMSRCQYLYGVTMAEKGVSRLVSVNLSEATAA
ncbi:MAG: chromosome segregation protein SMC [Alphaproteobacteria bacterium]|nr:chromosome segregation protein SMC [Alphaproteobacteria bacterium]